MKPISPKDQPAPAPAIKLEDVYYSLFRYKWIVVTCSLLGLAAAAAIYLLTPPLYQSEAKLLIRYVLESKAMTSVPDEAQVKSPDSRGENILNSELEILTSIDLAFQVATNVGPEKILARAGGGNDIGRAAGRVRSGLQVDVPRKSNVIRVLFEHPDPEVVAPVLRNLIEGYERKHLEVHRGVGIVNDFLARERDKLREKLSTIEDELKTLKTKIGVISLEDSKKAYIAEISKIRQDFYNAEAELAERSAAVKEMSKLAPSQSEADAAKYEVKLETLNSYKSLCTQLNSLITQHQDMLGKFSEENPSVERVKQQMALTEKDLRKLEQEHPKLKDLGIPINGLPSKTFDLSAEASHVTALQAKLAALGRQLTNSVSQAALLSENEAEILKLERERLMTEENLRRLQARLDEAMNDGKVTNISELQTPTGAFRNLTGLIKSIAFALGGGVGGGIALALLLGLFLNQSIQRPGDFETKLRLPLFLTIPWASARRRRKAPKPAATTVHHGDASGGSTAIAPWEPDHGLRTYHEALRDRLMTFFETRNMTHKPKLVAVTSANRGAGVTTIAAGLAASLSETGDGNVLLVDMNLDQGSAHPFHKGKPACGLPEILEAETRDAAQVQENLYLVSAAGGNDRLPRAMPKRFSHLVPKMKASDYDYIIFDMPPVSQTSVTPRLAGFMDMVVMVVEGEKTNRHAAAKAAALLAESGSNIAAVLNKGRHHLPGWLDQDV